MEIKEKVMLDKEELQQVQSLHSQFCQLKLTLGDL